jgi:two-component system response regulator
MVTSLSKAMQLYSLHCGELDRFRLQGREGTKMEHTSVLIVEDDLGDVVLTRRAFRMGSPERKVYAVRDGVEALDFLLCTGAYVDRDPRDMPELILLDMQLPRMNGLEVLRCLREEEHTHLLPIVILTSSTLRFRR